jgi:hypothetical protein
MTTAGEPQPVADRILARIYAEAVDAERTAAHQLIVLADCPNCACCD